MRRDATFSLISFVFGLFAIPTLVFAGGSLILAGLMAVAAIGAGMLGMGTNSRAIRALAIAGFAMGVAALWYTITGWAVSLDIAAAIGSLF
jgi:hypothetical protein